MTNRAPIVVVVGFLGAGKTTFIRDLLPLLEKRSLDPFVIINDYANARVDASSLKEEGRSVTPLNGNCICCDSIAELMNVLLEIPIAEGRLVLIEANGTTDSTALLEHLLVSPELRQRFEPVLQVAVVNVERWQKRHWHNELERLQVETASHIVFTRQETSSAERFAEVRSDIDWFNERGKWIKPEAFALEMDKLVQDAAPASIDSENVELESGGSKPDPVKQNHSHSKNQNHEHDHDHGHEHHDQHQLSHAFIGLEIKLPDPTPASQLHRWLKSLPKEVLRVKGVVRLAEEPDRWFQFQLVDAVVGEAKLFELPQKPAVPACAVLIGVGLDKVEIQRRFDEVAKEST
jgi:G3E family GTPase